MGAGPLIETVPVELAPPNRVVGFRDTPLRVGGLTVSVAVSDVVAKVAVIVATA